VRILVLGAAGMLGRKLAQRLTAANAIEGVTVSGLALVDIEEPERPAADFDVSASVADLTSRSAVAGLVSDRPDLIFHLAAVVSGEAEDDFEKGYRVNLDGVRTLFEEIRLAGTAYRPRVVFCSSIAVFGPPLPDLIGDEQRTTPATSYGTQKAIAELLLSDYSRRGFIDGIGLRLPTICVRPGKPNQAASGFFSSIIREPLNGEEATLPVPTEVRHWFASPRSGVGFLVHAAALDTALLGQHRCLTMPGVSATVATQIDALRRAAGDEAVALIRHQPDETIARIVATWPGAFDARRARALGFRAETNFDDIIRAHIEDELTRAYRHL
jgi:nucleoside-diphosphate-sugar epimerase